MTTDKDAPAGVSGHGHAPGWLETIEHEIEEKAIEPAEHVLKRAIIFDLPYIVMLSMALFGIGLTTLSAEPVLYYWELLTPVFCAVCIFAGWRHTTTKPDRVRLVWTQVLHWAAFLAAMWMIHHPVIREVVNVNATGLNLMTLLALATFVAGIHAAAWQICVVGLILALTVPAMAFIQQSALFGVIIVLGVIFVGVSLWLTLHKEKKRGAA